MWLMGMLNYYKPNKILNEVVIGHVNCNGKVTIMIESDCPKTSHNKMIEKYWKDSRWPLPCHWSKDFIPREYSPAIKDPRKYWFIGKGKRKKAEMLKGFVPYDL